ncbi:hypothetical protein SESBI_22306 [Sesbania bispinosa]|nr:hypothetical protein SESBI_22306 [Sesbania bispinosa]
MILDDNLRADDSVLVNEEGEDHGLCFGLIFGLGGAVAVEDGDEGGGTGGTRSSSYVCKMGFDCSSSFFHERTGENREIEPSFTPHLLNLVAMK